MNRTKIVDYYVNKLSDNFDISIVRSGLEQQSVKEDEIKTIVRLVDNELQKRLLRKRKDNARNNFLIVGIFLYVLGFFLPLLFEGNLIYIFLIFGSLLLIVGYFLGKR